MSHAIDANLIRGGNNPTPLLSLSYNDRTDELVCFDDLYVSIRAHIWLQGSEDITAFRRKTAKMLGEPAESLRTVEAPFINMPTPGVKKNYCSAVTGGAVSSARIKVYQRNSIGRKFLNLPEVQKKILQVQKIIIVI